MPLHIRDERALHLAKKLAAAKGVTMTRAVIDALESALAREGRPLRERIADLAREAQHSAGPGGRAVIRQEIDELWGNE